MILFTRVNISTGFVVIIAEIMFYHQGLVMRTRQYQEDKVATENMTWMY